jgi:hypothetical protein
MATVVPHRRRAKISPIAALARATRAGLNDLFNTRGPN